MKVRFAALAVVLVTTGVSAAPVLQRKAVVRYDVAGLAPLPFVRGAVGRETTWMLLDTGASTHVATAAVTRRGGVKTVAGGDNIEDHSSATLASTRAEAAQVSLEGWGKLPQGQLLVIEQNEASLASKANVGVFLSPQRLEEGRIVVLDLRIAELRTAADELEVMRTLATRARDPLLRGVRVCSGVFVAQARVEGQTADLLIDTGATRSTIYETTEAGRLLGPRTTKSNLQSETPSGKLQSRTYHGAQIEAGDFQVKTDVEVFSGGPPADCKTDGVLGFPALRSCVLVFGPRRGQLRARC
ncbi:retroviral-like aspartic protease family protein [Pendulispora rubella]|uniref:Retroviral-like aspartic protease family protein n=1 Tax=Pendulispora rubella TaxID=2741070 RepID=A0ABZ2L0C8_9BACT